MAFVALKRGPVINPKAPTRYGKIRGRWKQIDMSMNTRSISSFGNEILKLKIQIQKSMYTYPNVISASLSVGVTSFIMVSHQLHSIDPFQHNRSFRLLGSSLVMVLCWYALKNFIHHPCSYRGIGKKEGVGHCQHYLILAPMHRFFFLF